MLKNTSFDQSPVKLAGLVNDAFIKRSEEQTVLVFLHGYLDNAASFSSTLPYLADYPCVAIDLAGHGHSDHRSEDAHYHLVDYAYDLHRFINTQKIKQVILVGHSLGAIVCSIYAATQPQSLVGFIAIESIGPLSQSEQTSAEQIKHSFESRDRAYKAIKQPKSMVELVKARCAISDLSPTMAETILHRNTMRDKNGSLVWRTDKRLRTKSPMRMTEAQANNVIANIACPRALIIGSDGFDKIKRILRERESLFTGVEKIVIPGGHHVHLNSPEQVAQFIAKKIDSFE